MGNICRSPLAEAVFRHYVKLEGLSERIVTDSAGTHGYHIGHRPDRRARQVALQRGYRMDGILARQFTLNDFNDFDFVLAMDRDNLGTLNRVCPRAHAHKLGLLMRYAAGITSDEVPDPYYGSLSDFNIALDLVERGTRSFLDHLIALGEKK